MRRYDTVVEKNTVVDKIICNVCGNEITKDKHGYIKDHIHIEKTWGYNSSKDGEVHSIDICESCYDEIVKNFKISI